MLSLRAQFVPVVSRALLAFGLVAHCTSMHTQTASPVAVQNNTTAQQIQHDIATGNADAALHKLDGDTSLPERDRLRGQALYALNRFPDANTALVAALAVNSKDLEAVQLRGLTLFRLGRPAEAIPLLERAHAWGPETRVDPTYVLALCYIDTLRFDDARHAFAEQYGFAPDSPAAHLLAARMLLRREYVPTAQAEARKALALDPQLPEAHMLLGEIALAQQHHDEAIVELQAEARRDPLNGAVYDRLGDALSRKGDFVQAQQMLQRALLLEPNSTGPYILLGKVLLKRNDPASAAGFLERAERMDPANYMTHNYLGQAYRSMGRTADAQREIQMSQQIQTETAPKLETPK